MAEKLNFFFLLVCIIVLYIGLVIANGRISRLKGRMDSLDIYRMDSLDIYRKEIKKKEEGKDGV